MSSLPSVPCCRFELQPRLLLCRGARRVSTCFNSKRFRLNKKISQFHAVSVGDNAYKISTQEAQEIEVSSKADEGSIEEDNTNQNGGLFSSVKIFNQLKRYGVSGILSYGILNTVYYSTTFLLVWFYFYPAPGRKGYFTAVERFFKVMTMVWAGSQVTKLIRAAGALALAPFVDRGLSWFTERFKFKSRGKAFLAIVGICLGPALILFFVVTLLSA